MKAVFVFCEGNHDVVFASRSLGHIIGAQWVGSPIGELPSPLGPVPDPSNPKHPKVQSVIASRYAGRVLDGLKLQEAAHAPIPTFESVVRHGETLYVLVRCQGDSSAEAAIQLVDDFTAVLDPAFGTDITELAAAFLFDADANLAAREGAFAADYAPLLQGSPAPAHAAWTKAAIPVGLYVFHDTTTKQGTLEDLLAPLVATEWNGRWQAADSYLTTHAIPADPVMKKPVERIKAQITITGQFVCPGDPMTQVIGRKWLPENHFAGAESRSLVSFLQGVPW